MATVLQKLKEEGWFISEDGLKKLIENGTSDVKGLTKRALDYDLRDLVIVGGLPNDISKSSKVDLPPSGVVLQIINVRNISAPKANQESKTSPRLLLIDLTDGQNVCSGLDLEHLSSFSINVAPGTKVLLRNTVKTTQGLLLLTPQNIKLLGGQVQALFEKWETNRTLAKYAGIGGAGPRKPNGDTLKGTPPPWIPFGSKIKSVSENDAAFKSLNTTTKTREISKEESEFIELRNIAIAEASSKGELRKSFGGNNRQLMDHNVKKILDKGYTEEQAKQALKIARNNLERAMSNLKKRNTDSDRKPRTMNESSAPNSRRGNKSDDHLPAKPSGKVSLFDFLSDKIPDVEPTPPPSSSSSSTKLNPRKTNSSQLANFTAKTPNPTQRNNANHVPDSHRPSKFENNISSSFASRQKKDDIHSTRSKWNENSSNERPSNRSTYQQYQQSTHYHQQQPSHKTSQPQNKNQSLYQYSGNVGYQQNDKNIRYPANNNNNTPAVDHPPKQHNDLSNKSKTTSNMKYQANIKDLVESTANMQINNENKQSYKAAASSQSSQSSQARNFEEMFPQAKRFPYNPYKIMGFQNRETNEFAMNVLKTQMNDQKAPANINNSGFNNAYTTHNRNNQLIDGNNDHAKIKHKQPMPQPEIPIISVQQNVQASKPNFINTTVPAPFDMSTAQPQPPQAFIQPWNFKVGDRCLAKYWEDEKYYNAEIQAVTDKTCVVHFLDYGNLEEVLHTDCLPLTDSNHQPINQYNSLPPTRQILPMHPAYPPILPNKTGPTSVHFHQNNFPQHPGQGGTVMIPPPLAQPPMQQQRFMGNRQVYVPPAQRK